MVFICPLAVLNGYRGGDLLLNKRKAECMPSIDMKEKKKNNIIIQLVIEMLDAAVGRFLAAGVAPCNSLADDRCHINRD
jgi:hypothetical protein